MDCFDVIVAGSGPGATFAAYGLHGRRTLVLDAGFDAPPATLNGNIYDLRQRNSDLFPQLIGEEFQSLSNLDGRPISLKLKAPQMAYIVKAWRDLTPIASRTFEGVISLAKGGLANAWGAGVYRFTEQDLRGFPIGPADLAPHYGELTRHIGISGANDDLEPYFGHDDDLQPPMRLSPVFERLVSRYTRFRPQFHQERVYIGRPRLAVLTEQKEDRRPYSYSNLEFFQSRDPAIYTPAYTIEQLRHNGAIQYLSGRLVLTYSEEAGRVAVRARNLDDGRDETFYARKLCLGAGALNTARIVLASNKDFHSHLPLLDNPIAALPFFSLRHIGTPLAVNDSSLGQLNLVAAREEQGDALQATLYGATGPLRSDLLFTLPFSARGNLTALKYAAPAMGLLMLFYPAYENQGSYVRLRDSGELEVEFAAAPFDPALERRLLRLLRRAGGWTHPSLIQRPGMGQGLHFAGTLPMRSNPGRYQTDAWGRLEGTNHVHVVDGACFTHLPSKNLTFTIMANALRIGRELARRL